MADRADAIARARQHLHSGEFLAELDRRVGYRTESQNPGSGAALRAYLVEDLQPAFAALDFSTRLIESPSGKGPYLLADYREDASLPTVLTYGHGDVVDGMEGEWRDNLDPWRTTIKGERVYGRGTADNKGQHSINLAALRAVREARGGKLGFNAKFIIETGEEIGSPDLRQVCEAHARGAEGRSVPGLRRAAAFGRAADHFPRLPRRQPHPSRCQSARRRAIIPAIGAACSPIPRRSFPAPSRAWSTARGGCSSTRSSRRGFRTPIRAALADVKIEPTADEPQLSADWGEEGLSAAERLYAWNTLEVLAMSSGNIEKPANAIPGRAHAVLQLRFVVGTRYEEVIDAVRAHLHGNGFPMVEVSGTQRFAASRTDFDSPWVNWAAELIRQTTGKAPAILPNFGGSLPNDVFSEGLGLPTIWVPHSYPGCSQHAPDEHILLPVTEEALAIMAGLFWDLGEMKRAF